MANHVVTPEQEVWSGMLPVPPQMDEMPILYEDEEEGDMGEANQHVLSDEILHVGIGTHLATGQLQIYSNMNLYYRDGPPHPRTGSWPYVSPDFMVVEGFVLLPENVKSYKIGKEGPAPLAVGEIQSERSAQQRDLKEKLVVYSKLGIREYILVDPTGDYLPQRLLLKRLRPDGTWEDRQDPDLGITSELGFRVIWDVDGRLRVVDAKTGKKYVRPNEAQAELDKAKAEADKATAEIDKANATIQQLEAELAKFRSKNPESDQ